MNNDDDEDSWWQKITLPQVILIVAILWLLFGGIRCEFHIENKNSPASTSGQCITGTQP